jgi:ribonuclease P protein component
VYEGGGAIHTAHLVFYARPAEVGIRRLGVTVPKKTGTAVERNRIKRLIREVFRRERGSLPDGCVLIVNAKRRAAELDFEGVRTAFRRLSDRLAEEGFPPCAP